MQLSAAHPRPVRTSTVKAKVRPGRCLLHHRRRGAAHTGRPLPCPACPPPCSAEMLRAKLGAGGGIDRPAWGDQLLLWQRVSRLPTPPPVTGLPGAPSPPRLPVRLQSERSRDIPGLCPDGNKRWGTSTQHGLLSPPPNTHTEKSLHQVELHQLVLKGAYPSPGKPGARPASPQPKHHVS